MRICLFEDRHVAGLNPLALGRPAFDLLCGLSSLGGKQRRHFAAEHAGLFVRPHLAELTAARHPGEPVNDLFWLRSGPTILVNARWLPPTTPADLPRDLPRLLADGPFAAVAGGELAYAVLDTGRLEAVNPSTLDDCLTDWLDSLPWRDAGGAMVRRPWELVARNGPQLAADFDAALADHPEAGRRPAGFGLVGPADRLLIDPSAKVEPMVVADTSRGPVVNDREAVVSAFTRLEGPCYVGPGTRLHGARVGGGTTLGPHCRVGGEVEASIVQGFTNKAHGGFLGHSYVGSWVNLGAGTITADLRTDYAPVTVPIAGDEVSTGEVKVGSFIGDHTKTGLGVLLDPGSLIGAFARLLPTGRLAPRAVPSFCRSGPSGLREELDLDARFAAAEAAAGRRGRAFTAEAQSAWRAVFAQTAAERRQQVRDDQTRWLRRSA